jgi:hypothetical protein
MRDFLFGVLASLTASILFVICAKHLPHRTRAVFFFLFDRYLHCGIKFIYDNEDQAASDILMNAEKSHSVRVLSIRGFRLTSEDRPLSRLLRPDTKFNSLEVLLADPQSASLKERSRAFAVFGVTYVEPAQYQQDVVDSLNTLYDAKSEMRKSTSGRIDSRSHSDCCSQMTTCTYRFFPRARARR